jgi:hypothetical protein
MQLNVNLDNVKDFHVEADIDKVVIYFEESSQAVVSVTITHDLWQALKAEAQRVTLAVLSDITLVTENIRTVFPIDTTSDESPKTAVEAGIDRHPLLTHINECGSC